MDHQEQEQILWTNAARCRDCNRCVRVCPVKAVRKLRGQAQVVQERCLLCGACIRECPQRAKSYAQHAPYVSDLLARGGMVVASVAPSYASAFGPAEIRGLPSVLRQLGFGVVSETARGAEIAALSAREFIEHNPGRNHILGFCPAVVSYVTRYRPELTQALVPVASPMLIHARYLRSRYEGCRVVFIGPCPAKKAEARLAQAAGAVDAVLTFEELRLLTAGQDTDLITAEESGFDDSWPEYGRFLPLESGFSRAARLSQDALDRQVLSVSGPDNVIKAIDSLDASGDPCVLEALMCPGGCLGGAGISRPEPVSAFQARRLFLDTLSKQKTPAHAINAKTSGACVDCSVEYEPTPVREPHLAEADIRAVLISTGKSSSEDELNCGACGYDTCRDKAIAVLRGMADAEICIPSMRRYAELKKDALIEHSPNGIVITNQDLEIVHANPRFCEMFMTNHSCVGKKISYYMDATPFARVKAREVSLFDEIVHHAAYGLTCHQIIYTLGDDDSSQLACVLVNLTRSKKQEADLDLLRREALSRAEEVIDRQVEVAQEVAKLLGRGASETRLILKRLTDLVRGKEGE